MILIVGGTRPNFVKISSLHRELEKRNIEYVLVHSGQHYDKNMSDIFFEELGLKKPDWNLHVGKLSQSNQTAQIMEKFENVCNIEKPDLVIVVGDVTTTLACALVISKIPNIKLAHIESGCRSFDKSMPEEINRIVTDAVSDYLFVIEPDHVTNLFNEGIEKNVFLVGDNIADSLLHTTSKLAALESPENYILTTIHRQSNTDDVDNLTMILKALNSLSKTMKVKFPIHPRTRMVIKEKGLYHLLDTVEVLPPLGYIDFVKNLKDASIVLTDSGGVTIEAAILGIPCVVVRDTLERRFLIEEQMSFLVNNDTEKIIQRVESVKDKKVSLSEKWSMLLDGNASERIIDILLKEFK